MILICNVCHRFIPDSITMCKYCHSQSFTPFLENMLDEYANYQIYIDQVEIEGKPYKIDRILDKGGYSTVLKVIDHNYLAYALKVPFIFDFHFTNNQSYSANHINQSVKAMYNEIRMCQTHGRFQLNVMAKGQLKIINADNDEIVIPYILMELALANLHQIITAEARGEIYIPMAEKAVMIGDLLLSLKSFHDQGIIHRDLSPDNIFVIRREGEIHYVIADLGTTSSAHGPSSQSSRIVAHSYYLDPVRIMDKSFRYDVTSDIWSGGVIIAEILLGNFWINYCRQSLDSASKDNITSKDFRFLFLLPFKKFFDPEIYKIIDKCTHLQIGKRYEAIEPLQKKIHVYVKKISSAHYLEKNRFLRLYIHFNIKLPLKIKERKINLDYEGINNFYFNHFFDYSIKFSNLSITHGKLFSTNLYLLSFKKDSIFLTFNSEYFSKKINHFDEIITDSSGDMSFSFHIDVYYLK